MKTLSAERTFERVRVPRLASLHVSKSLSLFQDIARDHPPGGVMMYVRFPLSLRDVEGLLHERGIDVCHESIRTLVDQFGPLFAKEVKKRRSQQTRQVTQWRWHLDEVFVKIRGETHYLWGAVDHEGEVLEAFVTKTRDKSAALTFLKRALRQYGEPREIVTDRLRSYTAALKRIDYQGEHTFGRHLNNRAENSHLPFR